MIEFDFLVRQAAADGIEKLVAAVVVFDESGRPLLLRRAPDETLPGLWEYPGGGLEPGEDVQAAASRELAEESGLAAHDLEYVRHLDYTNQRHRLSRQLVFTMTVPDGTVITLSHEHDAYQWADPANFPTMSEGEREVLTMLLAKRATDGWRPVGTYVQTIANATMYGAFYFTDTHGRPFGLLSAINPGVWQMAGGDTDRGESPFDTALRETQEELGLDLRAENPAVVTRQQLLAVVHFEPNANWPLHKAGHIFWGGQLTDEQLGRIRLTHEHTEWRTDTLWGWRQQMLPADYLRLMTVDRARRSGRTLYVERPSRNAVDHHGAPRDFEGIIVFVTTPDGRLLLNLRDDKQGIAWPAHWTPIGGWREGIETAFETGAREVREEAGIYVTDLGVVPGPRHELVADTTVVLHGTWDGPENALICGEGQAVRLVPRSEIPTLTVPPYMDHYLGLVNSRNGASR